MPRIIIVFLVLLFFPLCVDAAQMSSQYTDKPLPDVPFLEEGELETLTRLYDEKPYNEKLLAYQVRLPKEWAKTPEQNIVGDVVVPNFLREIARFDAPSIRGLRSRFIIRAERLEAELSALQWFLQHAQMNAYTVQGMNEESRSKLEAFYVLVEQGVSYAVRSIVQVNGDRVVFAEYYLPVDLWGEGRAFQNSAIKSFKLENIKDIVQESFETHRYLNLMEFSYPASWQLNTLPSRGADRFQAEIINVRDEKTLKGRMDLRMISADTGKSLSEEIDDYKWELTTKGLTIGKVIETSDDFNFRENVKLGLVEVYALESRTDFAIPYELAFAILAGSGQYFLVTMITPGREDDFFLWSKNMELFKRVTESVQPF